MSESIEHCGRQSPEWVGGILFAGVVHPLKSWNGQTWDLGFRRPSRRTSETKILEQANWNSCEHIGFSVKYVNGSCQIFADIMLSNEDMKRRVNLLKIFSVITQYVEL